MDLSLMNTLGLLLSVCIAHIACYWIFFLLHYIQVLCQSKLCKADHAYLTYLMLQQLSHLNGHKLDHCQVEASYIFYVQFCLLLYCEHVYAHDFIWLLLVACTVLLHNYIYMKGWKPWANCGPVCSLENFHWCGEPCFVGAAILRGRCLLLIPRRGKHKSLTIWSAPYGGLV
jgi:hypothetical protein